MKRRLLLALFSVFLLLTPAISGAASITFSNDVNDSGDAGSFDFTSSVYTFLLPIWQIAIDPSTSSGLSPVTMDQTYFLPDGGVVSLSVINAQFDAGLSTFNSVDGDFGFDDFSNTRSVFTGFTTSFNSLTSFDPSNGSLTGSGFLNFLNQDITDNYFPGAPFYAFTLEVLFDPFPGDDNFTVHSFIFTAIPGEPGTPVPEPGTLALLGSGLVGLVGFGGRRFHRQ